MAGAGAMSTGRRRRESVPEPFPTPDRLSVSAGHPFVKAVNRPHAECGFDDVVEQVCRPIYPGLEDRPRGSSDGLGSLAGSAGEVAEADVAPIVVFVPGARSTVPSVPRA
jgi:hypothetical protein